MLHVLYLIAYDYLGKNLILLVCPVGLRDRILEKELPLAFRETFPGERAVYG